MERLLYSSSATPLKTYPKPSPFRPPLSRVDSSQLYFPSATRPSQSRRLNSISSKYEDPPSFSSPLSPSSNSAVNLPVPSSSQPVPPNGSAAEPHFLKHVAAEASGKQKVGKTLLVLSAFAAAIAIQPLFSPAALAIGGSFAANTAQPVLSSAWTGFLAGCLHTLSGPDHLAALAPLSIGRTPIEGAALGALWGCGHDAGQLIFGLLFLVLKDKLHIEVFRAWGSRVVGATLLIIGAIGIREVSEAQAPCMVLESGNSEVGMYEKFDKLPAEKRKKKIGFTTFATGVVHGLQPDGLMMVLPALALPSRLAGAAFLSMFLVGTVVAMGGYTAFVGTCSEALKDRVPRINEKLTWAASFVAIGLGLAILMSQFFGYSLY